MKGLASAAMQILTAAADIMTAAAVAHIATEDTGLLQKSNRKRADSLMTGGDGGLATQRLASIDATFVDLEPIDAALVDLERQAEDEPDSVTDTETHFITEMITMVEDQLETGLWNQSTADQASFDTKKTKHQSCTLHKEKRLEINTGDVSSAWKAITGKETTHTKCCVLQKNLDDYKADALLVSQGTWSTLVDEQMAAHRGLCDKKAEFVTALTSYKALSLAATTSCGNDQANAEDAYCTWLEAKVTTCVAFDECVSAVDLEAFKAEIVDRDGNRRSVWHSISKLKCRLRHLRDAFTSSGGASTFIADDTCNDEAAPALNHFGLTLAVPAANPCSGDADITNPLQPSIDDTTKCSAWLAAKYQDSIPTEVAVTSCKRSCIIPTEVGIVATVGCADVDPICPFYTRHSDACTKYNDNAASLCCACGGGSCHSGYSMTGSVCKENQCDCSGGEGATGTNCPTAGETKCTSCHSGYSMTGSACLENVQAACYGYEVTYKSTHQIDDITFINHDGVRTIPVMTSTTQDGCTITQPGTQDGHPEWSGCAGGRSWVPWDGNKASNSGCWEFTTHSILCDHDITAEQMEVKFWAQHMRSASGLTVTALNEQGDAIDVVADVDSIADLDFSITLERSTAATAALQQRASSRHDVRDLK